MTSCCVIKILAKTSGFTVRPNKLTLYRPLGQSASLQRADPGVLSRGQGGGVVQAQLTKILTLLSPQRMGIKVHLAYSNIFQGEPKLFHGAGVHCLFLKKQYST